MRENVYTGGIPNGYWLDENVEAVANLYILGVADGMFIMRDNLKAPLCRNNPNLTRDNIVDALRTYYREAPKNKRRQISAVIRGGCSELL